MAMPRTRFVRRSAIFARRRSSPWRPILLLLGIGFLALAGFGVSAATMEPSEMVFPETAPMSVQITTTELTAVERNAARGAGSLDEIELDTNS